MKKKENDKKTLAWILARAKGKKRLIAIVALINMVLGATGSGYALLLSDIVDAAVGKDMDAFQKACVLVVALVAVQFALRVILHFLEEFAMSSLENALKQRLFSRLLTGDYAGVTSVHTGEWLNRLTADTSAVSGGMTMVVGGVLGAVVRLLVALSVMVAVAPVFGICFIVGGAAAVIFIWVLRRQMKRMHTKVRDADGQVRIFASERLGSMMVIRAFEKEPQTMEQMDVLMHAHKSARMKKNHLSNIFKSGFSLITSFVYVYGAIYCGYGILNGTMNYGDFTALLQLVGQARGPVSNISQYFPMYTSMLASAERLMEAEKYGEETTDRGQVEIETYYRNSFRNIGLADAGFTYLPVGDPDSDKESRPTVLKNLNMEIEKGQYVAFCGPSGCGKSTVLKLLMSMYNLDEGQRYLTDADGQRPLTAVWRGLFAYVPQGNQLMSGTIRDVVTFADPQKRMQDEKIHMALKIACADQFMAEMPEGLDTLLGERGAGLSEGQMQRIAIARAIFSERPILLLDEATSALDEQTEAKVLDNLRNMTDKTVIIVTHRPAALEITDKIIHFKPKEE